MSRPAHFAWIDMKVDAELLDLQLKREPEKGYLFLSNESAPYFEAFLQAVPPSALPKKGTIVFKIEVFHQEES